MSGYGGKLLKIRQIHLFYFKYPDVDRHDEEAIYYISILSLRMYVLRGRSYRLDYIMNTILGCSCELKFEELIIRVMTGVITKRQVGSPLARISRDDSPKKGAIRHASVSCRRFCVLWLL